MASPSRMMRPVRYVLHLNSNKWFTLVASFFVMSCAGALYSFSIYSPKLKSALHYDQQTLTTVGFFKDLGANIGIVAGILFDVWGSWIVLLLAAVFNVFGYMMAWAAVTHKLPHPQVWQICLYLWVGASSGAFASTAVIVSCVKNFPRNRGIVIGLLKGFVGLSGAMLTQIYKSLYGDNPSSFMLVVAWFPTFVFLLFMFVVRPLKEKHLQDGGDEASRRYEMRNLYVFLGMALFLAVFLMILIVVQHLVHVSRPVNKALTVIMIIILALPVYVVIDSERRAKARLAVEQSFVDLESNPTSPKEKSLFDRESNPTSPKEKSLFDRESNPTSPTEKTLVDRESNPTGSPKLDNATQQSKTRLRVTTWLAKELRQIPKRGEDHSVLQALVSLDLWIVFIATTAGLGSGLMAIDNLGQMGTSLGYSQSNISTFTSLLSIWNFFGRVGFGFLSEVLLQKRGVPRPLFLAVVLAILAFGHLYIALAWPGSLYIGSVIIGMCFGAQMPIMFSIISEIFGLKYFGTLYNVGILASPLGTYLLSVRTAGHLYDEEAKKQIQQHPLKAKSSSHELGCSGTVCYRESLFIMAGVCMFGCIISAYLAVRTRHFYKSVKEKYQLR